MFSETEFLNTFENTKESSHGNFSLYWDAAPQFAHESSAEPSNYGDLSSYQPSPIVNELQSIEEHVSQEFEEGSPGIYSYLREFQEINEAQVQILSEPKISEDFSYKNIIDVPVKNVPLTSNSGRSVSTKCSDSDLELIRETEKAGWDNFTSEEGFKFAEPQEDEEKAIDFMYKMISQDAPLKAEKVSKKLSKRKIENIEPKNDLQNAAGLIAQRSRSSILKLFGKGSNDKLSYISQIIQEVFSTQEEVLEFKTFVEGFGTTHRTYATVMEKLHACPNRKSAKAFSECIKAFLNKAGSQDFEEYVNIKKGADVKMIIKKNKDAILVNFQSRFRDLVY